MKKQSVNYYKVSQNDYVIYKLNYKGLSWDDGLKVAKAKREFHLMHPCFDGIKKPIPMFDFDFMPNCLEYVYGIVISNDEMVDYYYIPKECKESIGYIENNFKEYFQLRKRGNLGSFYLTLHNEWRHIGERKRYYDLLMELKK